MGQGEILDLLKQNPDKSFSVHEIASALGHNLDVTRKCLKRLCKTGFIHYSGGANSGHHIRVRFKK
jgi:DNA-binding IscR family transcriptional regulator